MRAVVEDNLGNFVSILNVATHIFDLGKTLSMSELALIPEIPGIRIPMDFQQL